MPLGPAVEKKRGTVALGSNEAAAKGVEVMRVAREIWREREVARATLVTIVRGMMIVCGVGDFRKFKSHSCDWNSLVLRETES